MNTPKFLIADPCYILDKETWQSLCDKGTDTADEEFEGSWIEAFKDALAKYLFNNATEEEKEGLGLADFRHGIISTYAGDGDYYATTLKGDSSRISVDSGIIAIVPYSLYEKRKPEILFNNPYAEWLKIPEFSPYTLAYEYEEKGDPLDDRGIDEFITSIKLHIADSKHSSFDLSDKKN